MTKIAAGAIRAQAAARRRLAGALGLAPQALADALSAARRGRPVDPEVSLRAWR